MASCLLGLGPHDRDEDGGVAQVAARPPARSTVTPLTRGSATSNRIAEETTSRIASATRGPRCDGIGGSSLALGGSGSQFGWRCQMFGQVHGRGPRPGDAPSRRRRPGRGSRGRPSGCARDRGDPEDGLRRVVVPLDLGHRDVEVAMESCRGSPGRPPLRPRGSAPERSAISSRSDREMHRRP